METMERDRDTVSKQNLRELETTLSDKQKNEAKAQSNIDHQRYLYNLNSEISVCKL